MLIISYGAEQSPFMPRKIDGTPQDLKIRRDNYAYLFYTETSRAKNDTSVLYFREYSILNN